jgi:hypothetical protein
LDKGRKQNQALCEKILAKFNSVAAKQGEFADEADTSDDDDDDGGDVKKLAIRLDNRHIDPSDAVTMESWQHILKMINRLHSDYKKLKIDWKKSGEHRGMEDLLEGMKQNFTRNREEGTTKFVVTNLKLWYFFHILCKWNFISCLDTSNILAFPLQVSDQILSIRWSRIYQTKSNDDHQTDEALEVLLHLQLQLPMVQVIPVILVQQRRAKAGIMKHSL